MLRRFPAFLSFDLELHTRPRAEFLRAMGVDPLVYGLGKGEKILNSQDLSIECGVFHCIFKSLEHFVF